MSMWLIRSTAVTHVPYMLRLSLVVSKLFELFEELDDGGVSDFTPFIWNDDVLASFPSMLLKCLQVCGVIINTCEITVKNFIPNKCSSNYNNTRRLLLAATVWE